VARKPGCLGCRASWELGIDIVFSREGRAGSRIIRICATQENTVSTVSIVRALERNQPVTPPTPCYWVSPRPIGQTCATDADAADGADANAGTRFG
jgi:hypothetical protein